MRVKIYIFPNKIPYPLLVESIIPRIGESIIFNKEDLIVNRVIHDYDTHVVNIHTTIKIR